MIEWMFVRDVSIDYYKEFYKIDFLPHMMECLKWEVNKGVRTWRKVKSSSLQSIVA
jgi:hypothetical protein